MASRYQPRDDMEGQLTRIGPRESSLAHADPTSRRLAGLRYGVCLQLYNPRDQDVCDHVLSPHLSNPSLHLHALLLRFSRARMVYWSDGRQPGSVSPHELLLEAVRGPNRQGQMH